MKLKALKAAFPHTIPICAGFLFLGVSYGIYMNACGFSFVYPALMSLLIFGGSLEFVAAQMLLSPFAPVQSLIMGLLIQARHLFYGISLLEKYSGTGLKKLYLIFGMCDETFSINCCAKIPPDVDRGWFMFFVTLLNQIYWVAGATAGGLLGSLFSFDASGFSFVMTAMFVVFFVEQLLERENRFSASAGLAAAALCLKCFGADSFLLPCMAAIVVILAAAKNKLESREGAEK